MKKLFSFVLCFGLIFSLNLGGVKASANEVSPDEFLIRAGMPQAQVDSLDHDIKLFMVNDMKNNADVSTLEYIESSDMITSKVNQVFSEITFDASAFKSGDTIYIYPTYEFTADKKPAGNDSFSFQLGDAMKPYEYGGQVWYKDYTMSNWAVGGSMTANTQQFNGAEYSGSQLGSPDWSMKMKGAAYCHAKVGSGTDKRIIMSYMYNPNKYSYTISFTAGAIGITYNSSNTIYTNAKTAILSY
ncbi:hypothetical protein [Paenibacillus azoreducens]|uniref:Uncharacterized protein n=1 Tax=Paenibacillus azoreducens TaxID=116718 RepID=A0A919YH17_9BACL|nr:hypothetical protein [Paenibacillus azoreducens]GIO49173.1 hypothetical protein J34TS1_39380 [Paenibacillus azoreducens]